MIRPNVGGMRDNTAMYPQATVNTALHLSAIGVFDRENAQICGVSVAAIRNWRSGRRRAPRRDDRRAQCPRCHGRAVDEPAYAYLLGLYLGDGHIVRATRGVRARDLLQRRLAGSQSSCRESDVGRHAYIERLPRPATRMHSGQKLLKALAVPVPATWARAQAPPENRAGGMANPHRPEISWRIHQRAVPF